MSESIADLKRRSKCKVICLKINFKKDKNRKDRLLPQCMSCGKKGCDKIIEKIKQYYLEHRDWKKELSRNL